ncbi:MAG: hypothetical protein IOC82_16285 [Aestuariivirga sp.]|uniref:hypothetical protein n=1 Tax=Aestuariivirga sp. TaxID=2650926 RepID=UPI0025BEAEED|nr:hypothetical protein [Aestuariivirga sp.]MCA3562576.1 hypothetical protein [Aestuariivirga sp.]
MDEACLEKLAGILIGVSVAGAAAAGTGLLPGLTEVGTGAAGLWLRLTGQRRRNADAVLDKLTQTIRQEWQAWGQTASFADDGLRASVVKSFEEVIPRCTIPAASVVAARLDADAVADLVLAQAEVALPQVYADRNPRNTEAHHARLFLRDVTRRAYAALLAEPGYIDTIAPELWRGVLDGIGRIEDTTGRIDATTQETAEQLRHLTEMVAHLTRATAARASGITDDALIDLARRIAADVADPATAFRELENAVEIAIRVQAEGRQRSNLGNFVDEVLRRVAALSAKGQYDSAADEIDAALEQEQAESTARRLRLLDAGLKQDILRRDPESAARRLVQRADLEAGGAADIATLRALRREWYDRGLDAQLKFDESDEIEPWNINGLHIAINLSVITLARTDAMDDRGAVLNDLGVALHTLASHVTQNDKNKLLEEAVTAYRAALTELKQDAVPLNWAMTQNGLGNALMTLSSGTDMTRLKEAVGAYRAALTVLTQDREPLNRADTLGNEARARLALALRAGESANARQSLDQLKLVESTLRSGGDIRRANLHAVTILFAQTLVADLMSGRQP